MKQKLLIVMITLLSIAYVVGCAREQEVEVVQEVQEVEVKQEAEVVQAVEKAILVVSFGTSYNESRDATIGAIEEAIAGAFPEYEVRRAFTSQIIIDKLKEREGLEIDNVEEALDRAVADGVKELMVQPTHLMDGYEYQDLAKALEDYQDQFEALTLAKPLLASEEDFSRVVQAITKATEKYEDGETAICFMGHGTEADSNAIYAKLQEKLTQEGYENYYIGTVDAEPTLEVVIAKLKEKGSYKKVILQPLMVVAGDHANNDMAGEEEDSWKSVLEKEGYAVESILEGLGQIPAIQEIYVSHTKDAFGQDDLAKDVSLSVGNYPIEVESDSSMFRIVKAQLQVSEDGSMNAVITLSGTGYGKLYMGTKEEAGVAKEESFIPFQEDADGAFTYTIPVTALDQPIDCAAFSIKKEEWYDRKITFLAESILTVEATSEMVVVSLEGGSGKTTIASPAKTTVRNQVTYVTIAWNSPNYDYMLVEGEKYLPINTEGDSVFEIPVTIFNQPMTVIANTVAMSKPHEIEYQITVHESKESSRNDYGLIHEGSMELAYAEKFAVDYYQGGYTLLAIQEDEKWLVVPEGKEKPANLPEDVTVLQQPIRNVYLVASAAMNLFCELDALDSIRLSGQQAKGWYVEEAKAAMEKGDILYAGKYNKPDYERILAEECTLAIENQMISHAPEVVEKLEGFGIPVMVELSSYESHPLGRVEWIKFFGALLGKEELAQQLFLEQANMVEEIAKGERTDQTVAFFFLTSNGMAQVRKSSDYVAKMIELAGGTYLFHELGTDDAKKS